MRALPSGLDLGGPGGAGNAQFIVAQSRGPGTTTFPRGSQISVSEGLRQLVLLTAEGRMVCELVPFALHY